MTEPGSAASRLLRATTGGRWLRWRRSTGPQPGFAPDALPSHPPGDARDPGNRWIEAEPGRTAEDVPSLELVAVSKRYGDVQAVRDLDLRTGRGDIVVLIGPSGCGKTTTLRLVAGLERPSAGAVHIAGVTVAGPTWQPPERRRVGLVFQDHALFPHLDVTRNIAFGLHRLDSRGQRARVGEVLDLVRLAHLADRFPHELSGGEQQRVALARALAPGPAVLLLDEPFSSLDESLRAQVRADTVRVLRETGTTALVVTHDQTEALSVGDRVVVMRDGLVEQSGAPDEVFERPATRFVAAFMGDADFLPVFASAGGLSCEIGTLPGTANGLVNGRAEVALRPHEVALAPSPGSPATVVAFEYHGAFVLHTVRLASGRTLRSWQPHAVRHPVGTPVLITLVPGVTPTIVAGATSAER